LCGAKLLYCHSGRLPNNRACCNWALARLYLIDRGFMKILYYDCFAGISGDMNLAAMIDLGVSADYLKDELAKLGLEDEFCLECQPMKRSGIQGMQVHVLLGGGQGEHDDAHQHADEHGHKHENGHHHGHHHDHHHEHDHEHDHEHGHDHHGHGHKHSCGGHLPHRNLADIEAIIMQSGLSDPVRQTSLRIFTRIAEAEAKVHGKPLEEVHFHEVGATDSIVDIVGASICYHALGVDAVWASPLELGSGFVRCAHGMMPVPAPATAEILHGLPTSRGGVEHEATTPTGAAIVATLASATTASPVMTTLKTGYGIGHRESQRPNVERPNMLRVELAEVEACQAGAALQAEGHTASGHTEESQAATSRACLLQCNIDDMSGELLAETMDTLIEQGAGDVYFTPVIMKKSRPGVVVSVVCGEAERARFTELLFRHTTTLGVKVFLHDKAMLEQSFVSVSTPLGSVRLKQALLHGKVLRSKPEFEDCKALARSHGIPLAEVYAAISKVVGN